MGKIKGWKKVNITHQPKPMRVSGKEGIWVTDNSKIEVNKIGERYEVIRTFLGVTQSYLTFDTKKQALSYTIQYMKSHPNG